MQVNIIFLTTTALLLSPTLGQVVYRSPRPYYSQAQQCSERYISYFREFVALYRSGPCAAWPPYFDCCHLARLFPNTDSGIYEIGDPCIHTSLSPFTSKLHAKCEMFAVGGGWTIILQRNVTSGGDSVDFSSKRWDEYEDGFGSFSSDFWFGLSNLRCITQREAYELRVELTFSNGMKGAISYSSFNIDSRSNHYKLRIGSSPKNYYNITDALSPLNGYYFQTSDYATNPNCRGNVEGGFWLPTSGNCATRTNLNAGVGTWNGRNVASVTMMVRPVSCAIIKDCP